MLDQYKKDGVISCTAARLHSKPAVLALLAKLAAGKTFEQVVEEANGSPVRGTLANHRTTLYQVVNSVLDEKRMNTKVTWDTVGSTIYSLAELERLPEQTTDIDRNVVQLPLDAANDDGDVTKADGIHQTG